MHFRHRPQGVPAVEIDALQRQEDQVTEAGSFIDTTLSDLRFEPAHPWQAPNRTLLRLGYAAIAMTNDRLAEALREHAVVSQKKGDQLSPDAAYFAQQLTLLASRLMHDGVKQVPPDAYVNFADEETVKSLNPANMMPNWPRTGQKSAVEDWQDRGTPIVTPRFLLGVVAAGQTVQTDVNSMLNRLSDSAQVGAPIPSEYTGLPAHIRSLMTGAAEDLQYADHAVRTSEAGLSGDPLREAYLRAHAGFYNMAGSYVASVCPPMLGTQLSQP